MKGFAIHNAPTDHGGFIPATQVRSSQMGNLFVVAGDGHFCPKCQCWSTVIRSHDHVIFDGKAVAYVGDQLTCGARILPQQNHVVGERGDGYNNSSSNSFDKSAYSQSQVFDEQIQLVVDDDIKSVLSLIGYRLFVGQTSYEGELDSDGKTPRFTSDCCEEINNIEFFFNKKILRLQLGGSGRNHC